MRQSQEPDEAAALATGTVRGTLWNGLTFAISKLLLLVSTMVLARLLVPEDFGLLAIGLLVITYLDVVGDLGVGAAVIYRRERSAQDTSTAVVIAAVSGVVLAAVTAAVAPAVAAWFQEPRATAVIQALSLAFLLAMLSVVQENKLKKELEFKRRFVPEVGKATTKAVVSIALAVAGYGVWSLVWGQVVGTLVGTVLYWVVATWRFRPAFDRQVARELLRFGLPVTLLAILGVLIQTMDRLVIGQRLDAVALGLYVIALRLPELVVMNFCYIVSQTLFPAYAKARDHPERLRSGFRSALRFVTVVTAPLSLGLAVTAGDVIPLFFGEQWEASVPVMRVLALYAFVRSMSFNVGDVYKATGRPGVLNTIGAAKLALTVPVLWAVAPQGILPVAVALTAVTALITAVEIVVASRLLRLRLRLLLGEYLPGLVAGLAMVAATVAAQALLLDQVHVAVRLPTTVVLGAAVYAGTLALVSRDTVSRLVSALRQAARRTTSVEESQP